ncbi:alkaline phosphatase PhoX [Caldimonas brevitalea]|uniref:Translocation protein TolB n=1 Tax=Caldimonas brevitalea TaxID=413882 RepID=A0A0G3BLX4_9BURK|nr:alkaline phosphatase PhoX [Caldimonas brevitalea]AKJ28356.1 hypothetical protein AAW51_1665 [Caldimonas brevitalea]
MTFSNIPLDLPHRRAFLRLTLTTAGSLSLGGFLAACGGGDDDQESAPPSEPVPPPQPPAPARSPFENISALQPADGNGLMLPLGFSSRIVARSGQPPLPGAPAWHAAPDGGACFAAPDGGWVYVSNSEMALTSDLKFAGGVGALRFNRRGELTDSYPILKNTGGNCAGGATPWDTWLSCEEFELTLFGVQAAGASRRAGMVWECDPFTRWTDGQQGRSLPALGHFAHEAVCVDPVHRVLYLTEDADGGRFYRFVCDAADWPPGAPRPQMQQGRLQVLQLRGLPANVEVVAAAASAGLRLDEPCAVEWIDVKDPDEGQAFTRGMMELRGDDPPGLEFVKAEGTWFFNGIVYFATQNNHRIWAYDTRNQTLEFIYDGSGNATDAIKFAVNRPDNITVSPFGEIVATEDGGNLEIGVLRPDRTSQAIARLLGHDRSETTGPAFSPDGMRLYFSSQRGTSGDPEDGMTFEIILPTAAR